VSHVADVVLGGLRSLSALPREVPGPQTGAVQTKPPARRSTYTGGTAVMAVMDRYGPRHGTTVLFMRVAASARSMCIY